MAYFFRTIKTRRTLLAVAVIFAGSFVLLASSFASRKQNGEPVAPAVQAAQTASPPSTPAPIGMGTRAKGLIGIVLIIGICFAISNNRKAIKLRHIAWGLGLQLILALFVLKTPFGLKFFEMIGRGISRLLDFSLVGADFVFGSLAHQDRPTGFIFAFIALPPIIFISSFFSVLYHLGIMQKIVSSMAKVMQWTMRVSGAESLSASANVFMGQTEAPLIVAPYVPGMTMSELLCLMIGGMATVSGGIMAVYISIVGGTDVAERVRIATYLLTGSVMAAPCAIMLSKLIFPETGAPVTAGEVKIVVKSEDANVIDAAARGASAGMTLAINVAAMLIAFLALLALLNFLLGIGGGAVAWAAVKLGMQPGAWIEHVSLQMILGKIFAPLAFVMGVPPGDVQAVGNLLGEKMILNELIAYQDLATLKAALHPHSVMIAAYALCGFANIGSIGIQLGGIGGIAPNRRGDLATLGLRALVGGFLATCLTASLAGILATQ